MFDSFSAVLLAVIFIVMLLLRISALEQRLSALSHLNGKLDALLKHGGVDYNPYASLPDEVVQALKRGKQIQAIKRYRQATGAGLKEAKAFIEEAQRRGTPGA